MPPLGTLFKNAVLAVRPSARIEKIPLDDLYALFDLHNEKYRDAPSMTVQTHMYLNHPPSVRDMDHGMTVAWYANPSRKFTVEGTKSQILEEEDEPAFTVQSSPAIFVNRQRLNRWTRGISIVVRPSITSIHDGNIAFALYGTYGKDNMVTIKKIMVPRNAPEQEEKRPLSLIWGMGTKDPYYKVSLYNDIVAQSLAYGQMCARQVMEGRHPTPAQNRRQAETLPFKTPMEFLKQSRAPA